MCERLHPLSKRGYQRLSWDKFHATFFSQPEVLTEERKRDLQTVARLLGKLQTCPPCRKEFAKILDKYPFEASTGIEAARWSVDVHNAVNTRLGKPVIPWDVVAAYYYGPKDACYPPASFHDPIAEAAKMARRRQLVTSMVCAFLLGLLVAGVGVWFWRRPTVHRRVPFMLQR